MIITDKEAAAIIRLLDRCIWDGNNPTFSGMSTEDTHLIMNVYRRSLIQEFHAVDERLKAAAGKLKLSTTYGKITGGEK